jgi:hypothetical protein
MRAYEQAARRDAAHLTQSKRRCQAFIFAGAPFLPTQPMKQARQ